MEEQISKALEPGEKLLWKGRPEAFETLDKTHKSSILCASAIKLLIMLCVIGAYIVSTSRGGNFSLLILAVLCAITVFMLAMPFLTARHLRRQIFYVLSDRRIIRLGFAEGSVPYSRIKTAALKSDSDGHVSLLCGPRALKLKASRRRQNADCAFENYADENQCVCAVLYALPMDSRLERILHEHLPL